MLRPDLLEIARLIPYNSHVIDIGAGDGTLLSYLQNEKNCQTRGIERNPKRVNRCFSKGLSVIHGDAETELLAFKPHHFDYAILSRTLPATDDPVQMIKEILRIARFGILSMPNFGYWRVRCHLALKGTMPVTQGLSAPWYETENIHLCTIKDFYALMKSLNIHITHAIGITQGHKIRFFKPHSPFMNLMAEEAVFMIKESS